MTDPTSGALPLVAVLPWADNVSVVPGLARGDTTGFPGDGEMAQRCRAIDWAATPLGPVAGWPAALRTAVRLMLVTPIATSLWVGPSYTLLYNDAYRRILGAKHPAALGRSGATVWDELWPALEPQFTAVREGGPAIYADDVLLRMERLAGGAAEDAWFTYALRALTDEAGAAGSGRGLAVYNVAVETTDRLRAERALAVERRQLGAVFDQSPSFLAVLRGPDNVFERANAAYEQIISQGRDVVGKTLFDALPETRGQGFDGYLAQVRATGDPLVFLELPVLLERTPGAPREERFINITYMPLVEADGTHDAVIAHGTDVTDQVRARREVEAARQAAEEANQAKAGFLANMSHELRTPLNAIGGYVQLVDMGLHGPVTDAQREALARVTRAQQHLLGLTNGILNYARVESGRVQYDVQAVPVGEVLADVAPMLEPQMAAKGFAFAVEPPPVGSLLAEGLLAHGSAAEDPLVVWADRDKLRQVLLNLLSNAVKFTEAGGRVTVGAAVRPGALGDLVFLRVRDTGRGIPRDQQAAVFEPFVQVGKQFAGESAGTGLGLAISRDLARGMGGDLRVRSHEGEGSTFTVALRRVVASNGTLVDQRTHDERDRGERRTEEHWRASAGDPIRDRRALDGAVGGSA